jgi:hypothetical protein
VALAGLSVHRAAVTVGQWQPRVHSRGRAIPDSPIFGQSGPRFAFPAESGTGGIPCFKPELPNPAESGNG